MRPSSRRRAALLPALGLVYACQGDTTSPTASTPDLGAYGGPAAAATGPVASLSVTPDSQLVFVGDELQVTAVPRNRAGELLDRSVVWSSGNTSVVALVGPPVLAMTFRALRTGKTTVKATVEERSRFAKVVVRGVGGARIVVTPAETTVEPVDTVQLTATGLTQTGETARVNVTWTAERGSVSAAGVHVADDEPGTYRVIATSRFGAADTALVTVSGEPDPDPDPDPAPLASVVLVPEGATLAPGEILRFEAYGLTEAGDSVATGVAYAADGGTIAGDGRYTAGSTPGTYRVIASSPEGPADTATVVVTAPAPGRVRLLPAVAASRPAETTRFAATVLDANGSVVSGTTSWQATCGTVSGTGVYTAPQGEGGPCLVIAASGDMADTTVVTILRSVAGQGVPFGINDLWNTATTTRTNGAALTASREYFPASDMVRHIEAARTRGVRLVLVMTGGSHDRYKTDGVFDQTKWEAAMNRFDTPEIRAAIEAGVADGTIIGNSVMDEPQQSGTTAKDWGPPGTMTKARVDQLCAYVKGIFPTLPVGVGHDQSAFEPGNSYQVCEFFMTQYAHRKGEITAWRDAALGMALRDDMAVIFSLNLLDGGIQDRSGALDCAGTGGLGTHGRNCRMTPDQVREWAALLGPAGCALLGWRWDGDFMASLENQAALSEVAIMLASLPRRSCGAR